MDPRDRLTAECFDRAIAITRRALASYRNAHRDPGPPAFHPTPTDGRDLRVHAHRTPPGITPAERILVCAFLRRYVIWCAKARHVGRLRNAVDLLIEVAAT